MMYLCAHQISSQLPPDLAHLLPWSTSSSIRTHANNDLQEEIEILFAHDGPKHRKIKPGDSRLDQEILNVLAEKGRGMSASEYVKKVKHEKHERVEETTVQHV